MMIRVANITNGLAFKPYDNVCYFQSQHGHHAGCGYFRIDAMPYQVIIQILRGEHIKIIDATRRHKILTDALKFGVPVWCLVFNRAMGNRYTKVCSWQTREMRMIANSDLHKPTAHSIRKIARNLGLLNGTHAIIGKNIHLECHQGFIADDKPKRLQFILGNSSMVRAVAL